MAEIIVLYDLMGRVVSDEFKVKTKHSRVNMSQYPSGVYFLKFFFENEIQTRKIVLE